MRSGGRLRRRGLYYAHYHLQAFVAVEQQGRWQKADEVPGTAALNVGATAAIQSVSCSAPASCGAGGFYSDKASQLEPFVVAERNGRWGTAGAVPGMAALNHGNSWITSMSCAPPGVCSAGGLYQDRSGSYQAFVVSTG